jgi:hypothetical protein
VASQCIVTPDDKTRLIVLVLINPLEYFRINKGVHVAHLAAIPWQGQDRLTG